jgi:predicted histidine transporter YuiF (NhaC family)
MAPNPESNANATYWGRYKGRWRQCFVLMFALGFVVIVAERFDEVHNATNAAALTLDALVGGVGDGLLVGSLVCLLVAIPRGRDHVG